MARNQQRRMSRLGAVLALWLLVVPAAAKATLTNVLQGHPSPYLALHGDDPVAWQEWGPAVLERARRENRLVYVSVGYFSCHWCHVMQRESYKNPVIAQYLNTHFIPVKVDRELEPALDAHLIAFTEATRGVSGWPLNVFLTPEGFPLYAMLYAPPQEFRAAFERLQRLWAKNASKLRELARAAALRPPSLGQPPVQPARAYAEKLVAGALAVADLMRGGFGEESKFPSVPQLEFLLAHQAQQVNPKLEAFLRLTLDHMATGGLQDHLGGGFFRYTVDPGWKTPHFEKMLYDNALLARLYLRAARLLKHAPYEAVARRTLDFMLRELRDTSGGFIAALSAVDDRGVEGGYYLWSLDELKTLLRSTKFAAFRHAYGLTDPPAFEEGYLPIPQRGAEQVAKALKRKPAEVRGWLVSAEHKLFAARQARKLPRDTMLLAGWNGLALAAFAEAARATGEERYRVAARGARDYLMNTLWDGRALMRAVHGGRAVGAVSLEDYAYVALGLLEWARLTGEREDFRQAAIVAAMAWKRFYGAEGWRLSQKSALAATAGTAVAAIADGPLPSPSAVLIEVSLVLAAERGEKGLGAQAADALKRARALL